MEIDSFLDLVRKRRSIRSFKPDAVPDEYIEKLLEAGRWAMSGANGQPWEFIVIKDEETKNKLHKIYMEGRVLTHDLEMTRVEDLRHPGAAAEVDSLTWFGGAPVIIAVCGDTRTIQTSVLAASLLGRSEMIHCNLANTCHNIQLAAAALGLGAEWVTLGRAVDEKVRALLGVPDVFIIDTIIPVGYPAHEPGPGYRRNLEEMVHYDRYDLSKFRSNKQVIEFISNIRKMGKKRYLVKDDK